MSEYRKIKSLNYLYEINEKGEIRNVKSKKPVHGYLEKNGYIRVKFENKCLGSTVRTSVHRLVAEAFIPNPDNLPEVNHKDSNRANNCLSNLEWVTHSGNMKHAYHKGINQWPLREHSEITRKAVSNGIHAFKSISDAGEWLAAQGLVKNKVSGIAGVSSVCNGKRHTIGGYPWNYV
ncbi:MAG: HNH endonuclease [Lachnospiraceae bacterium]|nr:HNH endonuclease [Lachnospiraceae bacterium]